MANENKRRILQFFLFLATFITTTLAGSEWAYGRSILQPDYSWLDFANGMSYSIPFLIFLTAHEFGHYFTAVFYRVKTSLPYYIPVPPAIIPLSIGTFGAVIRLRSRPKSSVENFDIGVAGPIAGFVITMVMMFYAFKTLPPPEYVFQFHPEYEQYGLNYADYVYEPEFTAGTGVIDVEIGGNLLFWFFSEFVADTGRAPNGHELMHYPMLLACYLALFFTSLNLLPIGQLDGGHVVYGLFGTRRHRIIATAFFVALIFYAGLGLPFLHLDFPGTILGLPVPMVALPGYLFFLKVCFYGLRLPPRDTWMYALLMFAAHFTSVNLFPEITGYHGWLLFGLIVGRVFGIRHPGSEIEQPLDARRIAIGWIALLIFVLCFSPFPLAITGPL